MKNSIKTLIMVAITALSGIVLNGIPSTTVQWEIAGITVLGTTLLYMGKNWLFPSVSIYGSLDLRDLISGVLVAISNGLSNYVAQATMDGPVDWNSLLKQVGLLVVMYIAMKFSSISPEQKEAISNNPSASKYKKLIPFVAILFLLQSCNPLVATKSDSQKTAKQNAKITGEFVYKTMANNAELTVTVPYEPFADSYSGMLDEVQKFTSADSVRKNAKLQFENDKLLRAMIIDKIKYHKEHPLNLGKIKSEWNDVGSLYDAVIRAEKYLK